MSTREIVLSPEVLAQALNTAHPQHAASLKALQMSASHGLCALIPTGCADCLNHLLESSGADAPGLLKLADLPLKISWMATLCPDDPESWIAQPGVWRHQVLAALQQTGSEARLLTRDSHFLKHEPAALTPEDFCNSLATESHPPVPLEFIDLKAQQDRLRPALERRVAKVLRHGRYILGPEVAELEKALAAFTGVSQAIGFSNGTDALLAALMALDVGPGDAVLTTSFSFFATAETIAQVGAVPVFLDICADTWNLDPNTLETAIERFRQNSPGLCLRGLVTVDLFGQPCDYERILPILEKAQLWLLQDGAQAFGALWQGSRVPTQGLIGCTSFFPAKPLGAYGDAGAVFTEDAALADKLRSIRVHGQSGDDKYNNLRIGLNARIDTLQAAILLEKLAIYEEEISLRGEVACAYFGDLMDLNEQAGETILRLPTILPGTTSVWAQFVIEVPHRDQVQAALRADGIPTAVYYGKPMHLLEAMRPFGGKPGDCPKAEAAARRVLALPFHPYLSAEDRRRIVNSLRRALLNP